MNEEIIGHTEIMVRETVRLYLMNVVNELGVNVNLPGSYTNSDVEKWKQKVKNDIITIIDETLEIYKDYYAKVNEFKEYFL